MTLYRPPPTFEAGSRLGSSGSDVQARLRGPVQASRAAPTMALLRSSSCDTSSRSAGSHGRRGGPASDRLDRVGQAGIDPRSSPNGSSLVRKGSVDRPSFQGLGEFTGHPTGANDGGPRYVRGRPVLRDATSSPRRPVAAAAPSPDVSSRTAAYLRARRSGPCACGHATSRRDSPGRGDDGRPVLQPHAGRCRDARNPCSRTATRRPFPRPAASTPGFQAHSLANTCQ